jgi:hypothetical protein
VSNGWQYRDGTLDRCGYDPVLVAAAVVVGNLDWEVLRSVRWMDVEVQCPSPGGVLIGAGRASSA